MAAEDIDEGVAVVSKHPRKETELRYRITTDTSGTKATLASITAKRPTGTNDGGSLVFSTDVAGGELAQRMLIDSQGNVGIEKALSGPSLTVLGTATIGEVASTGEALTANGDVRVTGEVKAASFTGDGAGLVNVTPANDSITNIRLAEDPASLRKVSGGKMVVKDGNVGIGVQSPEGPLHVWTGERGALEISGRNPTIRFTSEARASWRIEVTEDGELEIAPRGGSTFRRLLLRRNGSVFTGILDVGSFSARLDASFEGDAFIKGFVAIGERSLSIDSTLDVGSRMRVKQGRSTSAGIWFSQTSRPDAAFVGMANDSEVGFYSGGSWGLKMQTDNHSTHVHGRLTADNKAFKIDHPLDPANKYLYHSSVESPEMMNIYNGNVITDSEGSVTVSLPDYFQALNRDFRYQLTVIGKPALAAVEREIEKNTFTIRTDHPNVKVSWQVTGIRHDASARANRLPVEEEKPEAERGLFLHPEHFGHPKSKGIAFADFSGGMGEPLAQDKVSAETYNDSADA